MFAFEEDDFDPEAEWIYRVAWKWWDYEKNNWNRTVQYHSSQEAVDAVVKRMTSEGTRAVGLSVVNYETKGTMKYGSRTK